MKNRIGLLVGTLISMLFVLKFSGIEVWSCLPEVVQKLMLCPPEGTDWYEILMIINNLSLAYIASVIFYIILYYIPERNRANKAFLFVKSDLEMIYDAMSYIIRMHLFNLDIIIDEKDIKKADLCEMCKIKVSHKIKFADIQHMKDGKTINVKGDRFDIPRDMQKRIITINKTIDHICGLPIVGSLDEEIVKLVLEIQESKIYIFFKDVDETADLDAFNCDLTHINLDQYFFEFIGYHLKMSKLKITLMDYKFSKMTQEEIENSCRKQYYNLNRTVFVLYSYEKIKYTLSYLTNIVLDENSVHKLNGVLMEMLLCYEIDNKKYKYLLLEAKCVVEYLKEYHEDKEFELCTFLNYLQVIFRLRKLNDEEKVQVMTILKNEESGRMNRLGASIILEDMIESNRIFAELEEGEKKGFIQLPIYFLWSNPPVPPDLNSYPFN